MSSLSSWKKSGTVNKKKTFTGFPRVGKPGVQIEIKNSFTQNVGLIQFDTTQFLNKWYSGLGFERTNDSKLQAEVERNERSLARGTYFKNHSLTSPLSFGQVHEVTF
jgi:hypothetical protein